MTTSSEEEQAVPKTTSRRFLVRYFIKPGRSGKNVDVNKANKLFKMVKTMFLF